MRKSEMQKGYYIGIMSGTSLDGVDVVLCEIDGEGCRLIEETTYPMPEVLRLEIKAMIAEETTLAQVGEMDHRLGVLFADAVERLLLKGAIDRSEIVAIGSHGQTLWHQPQGRYPFTMQLGDPNIIAARTGIPVVADFRRKDVAFGGEGAPFAPAFHEFIFGNINAGVVVVNIGGMANITLLGDPLVGYDTGPGNVLMDSWIAQHQGVSYDTEGEWARSGRVDYRLLDAMMADPYFSQPHPKSTGREKFNIDWLEKILSKTEALQSNADNHSYLLPSISSLNPEDIQRTLLELTALTISNEVLKENPDLLLLCGGGAKNAFLVERIKALLPNVEVGIAEYADQIEAICFAWLAYKRIHQEPVNLKTVTGASVNTILGGLYV